MIKSMHQMHLMKQKNNSITKALNVRSYCESKEKLDVQSLLFYHLEALLSPRRVNH